MGTTPTAGASPAQGQQQRRQRRPSEIYGTEPTRRSSRPLQPSTCFDLDTRERIHLFQEKVGSILYTAVTVRLEVAFAACKTRPRSTTRRQTRSFFAATRFLADNRVQGVE